MMCRIIVVLEAFVLFMYGMYLSLPPTEEVDVQNLPLGIALLFIAFLFGVISFKEYWDS